VKRVTAHVTINENMKRPKTNILFVFFNFSAPKAQMHLSLSLSFSLSLSLSLSLLYSYYALLYNTRVNPIKQKIYFGRDFSRVGTRPSRNLALVSESVNSSIPFRLFAPDNQATFQLRRVKYQAMWWSASVVSLHALPRGSCCSRTQHNTHAPDIRATYTRSPSPHA